MTAAVGAAASLGARGRRSGSAATHAALGPSPIAPARCAELGTALGRHALRPRRARREPRGRVPRARRSRVPRRPGTSSRPGIGPTHGVRTPLQVAVRTRASSARRAAPRPRSSCSSPTGSCASRSARPAGSRSRPSQRTLAREPERTWQLLRRAAAEARRLDHGRHPRPPVRQGHPRRAVPLGRARAARPSRRRAGSAGSSARRIATMPFVEPARRPRRPTSPRTACELLATLIGDAEPDVQKALSWAYRSMALVDLAGHDGRPRSARRSVAAAHRRRPPRLGRSATACRSSTAPTRPTHPRPPRRHPPPRRAPRRPRGPPRLAARFGGLGLGAPAARATADLILIDEEPPS